MKRRRSAIPMTDRTIPAQNKLALKGELRLIKPKCNSPLFHFVAADTLASEVVRAPQVW